jgi:uncharacterized phage protein (TIGR01671 family)
MREIKFRAWDIQVKIMRSHENFNDMFSYSESSELDYWLNNPNHIIVMQYTGLKDKNGKEIYEGDIILTRYIDGNSSAPLIVIYSVPHAAFVIESRDSVLRYFVYDGRVGLQYEVIGNIYENPELLGEKHELS